MKIYMAPSNYLDYFVYQGQRYYLTVNRALVSDYGKYGICPPLGRGFYTVISKKEFKEIKAAYELQKNNWQKALNGYLNNGGDRKQLSLF